MTKLQKTGKRMVTARSTCIAQTQFELLVLLPLSRQSCPQQHCSRPFLLILAREVPLFYHLHCYIYAASQPILIFVYLTRCNCLREPCRASAYDKIRHKIARLQKPVQISWPSARQTLSPTQTASIYTLFCGISLRHIFLAISKAPGSIGKRQF